jgi:hypothetical protein
MDIHGCAKRLEAARRNLSKLEHGELLLGFLDHLQALGLSLSRVLKYATQLCILNYYIGYRNYQKVAHS